ncbi:kinase-like domain-containing protein [Aspergillus taichungensis]|uniref:non-specific serine/threonine protein kinase n=1 Tax=Aspergillus taichungensis TaxID=482145 RepID=A0A2J5HGZ5_9EURO|nr:kinase-like domain-containing protein [Aspergillus taichungensis]
MKRLYSFSIRTLSLHKAGLPCFHRQPPRAFSFNASKSTALTNSTSRVLYEPIESVERMEYYQEEGYHPVEIGDHFHDRYRVVHKLGHGTYSTIWLARDEICNRYVAVKICTADSDPLEIDVLSQLSKPLKLSDIGTTMIPSILDRFNIQGPNGNHACLVTSPARMSLSEAKKESWIGLFQIDVARALAAQLATVIRYMHSEGFLSTKELYELYGEPELEPVNRLDGQTPPPGVPQYGVVPIWLGELTRFELTMPLTFSSDIWTLACTIWHIVAQRSLFEGFLTNEDDMTCQQIAALGPLPSEWWGKWEGRGNHFTDDGEPNNRATSQYRPENRPSAQQVLESEWMVKWAIPEYERKNLYLMILDLAGLFIIDHVGSIS